MTDPINHPPHYTAGPIKSIDVIEQTVRFAPTPMMRRLQWQILKYLLSMWLKANPLQDARKARWYLDRLIQRLEGPQP